MLAKIGIQVDLDAMTKSIYFKKLQELDTDLYLLGWTSGTYDAHHPMRFLVHSRDAEKSLGSWNFGGYGNPEADALIEAIGSEVDPALRQSMIDQVHTIHKDDIGHIPLHQQALAWGVRDGVDVVQRADNFFNLYRVQVE
jgi:peptide/nickel transport system substrate-binding protein